MSDFQIPEILVQSPWEVEELLGNSINCTKRPCNLSISEKLKEKLLKKNSLRKDEQIQNSNEQRPIFGAPLGPENLFDSNSNTQTDENNNSDKHQTSGSVLITNTSVVVNNTGLLEPSTKVNNGSTKETNNRNFLTVNWTQRQDVINNKRKSSPNPTTTNNSATSHKELGNRHLLNGNHQLRPKTISLKSHHFQMGEEDFYVDSSDEDDEDDDSDMEFDNTIKRSITYRKTLVHDSNNVAERQILLKRKTRPWVIDDTSLSAMKKMKL